jgi:hypothetical protein
VLGVPPLGSRKDSLSAKAGIWRTLSGFRKARERSFSEPSASRSGEPGSSGGSWALSLLDLGGTYFRFVAAFRDAAERLRAGDLGARFPPGSFPPALPFVPG